MSNRAWESSTLVNLVEDAIGGLWGSAPGTDKPDETDVLVVRGADFRNWNKRRALDAAPRRIPVRSLERRQLKPGDLVLEVSGGSPAQPVGRVLVIDESAVSESLSPLICSNFCRKVRLKPGVDPFFVKRQLDWLYGSGHTDRFQTSTTNIRNLQVDDFLHGTEIVLPEREIQASLTALLDTIEDKRTSGSGHLVAARRAIEQFRQAVLAAACSGRLTSDWREAHAATEPADKLVERSQQLLAALSARRSADEPWSEPEWLKLPDSWCWAPCRELAAIKGGIQKQPKRSPKDNPHPYLRVANVLRGRLDLAEVHDFELFGDELDTYRLESGDLLVVEGNGSASEMGRAAIWRGEIPDCVHQNHIIRVRCMAMDPQFVEMFWNSPIGAREVASLAVTSAGLYSLSTKKIGAIPIPVAPLEEQQEIVRRASKLLAVAEGLLKRVDHSTRSVERSSQAVLAKAFRGDLLPNRGQK